MKKGEDKRASELVRAALEYRLARPWGELGTLMFGIVLAGEEREIVGLRAGGDRGCHLIVGEGAYKGVHAAFEAADERLLAQPGWVRMVLAFDRLDRIQHKFRSTLEAAGYRARREQEVPVFLVEPGSGDARPPGRAEMRLLAACLRGIVRAARGGGDAPTEPNGEGGRMLELRLGGAPLGSTVETGWVQAPIGQERWQPSPKVLGLARTEATWEVGLVLVPRLLHGARRDGVALLAREDGSAGRAAAELLEDRNPKSAEMALEELLLGQASGLGGGLQPGLPSRVRLAPLSGLEALDAALGRCFEELGIPVEQEEGSRPFESLALRLMRSPGGVLRDVPKSVWGQDPEAPSAAELLAFERALQKELMNELFQNLEDPKQRQKLERIGSKYFDLKVRGFYEWLWLPGALIGFVEWWAADLRTRAGARTVVERLAQQRSLEPAVFALLLARSHAYLSFFRVLEAEPGGPMRVECLLTGLTFNIDRCFGPWDFSPGATLALRILEVGIITIGIVASSHFSEVRLKGMIEYGREKLPEWGPGFLRVNGWFLGSLWKEEPALEAAVPFGTGTGLGSTPQVAPGGMGPEDIPEEVAEQAYEQFHRHYRTWIDEPVPALGGLTPRQACAFPAGKRQVQLLINEMPVLTLGGRIFRPPVNELRRELGI